MAARFPLFRFPPNVAEILLRDLKLVDLFELSQLSKSAFNLVKNTVLLYKGNASLEVRLQSSRYVTLSCGTEDCVFWNFFSNRTSARYDLENFEQQRVMQIDNQNETSSHLNLARKSSNCYGCASNSIEDVLQFIQYISDLFNANVAQLTVHASQFHNLQAIQSLSVLRKCKHVMILNGTVSHEEMRRVLEGFECEKLQVECCPEPNFHYDLPIAIGDFQSFAGHWFKGPMLLNLDFQYLMIRGCELTDEDVNAFLHQWESGAKTPRSMFFMKHYGNQDSSGVYENNRLERWNLESVVHNFWITEHFSPPINPLSNITVHRVIDDETLNITLLDGQSQSLLLIQSDYNPVENPVGPTEHFYPGFRRRTLGHLL